MSNYGQLDEIYRTGKRVKKDRDWSEYPINTIAPAIMGGYWHRVERGWKWCTGDTFPGPGADNTGMVILPVDPNAAYNAKVREIAEILAKNDHPIMFQGFEMFGGMVEDNSGAMERAIESMIPFALAMVAEMAKELTGFAIATGACTAEYMNKYLIDRGLIPAKPEDNAR